MKGLKLWIMTLVEYDGVGNAKILKSFSKVAKDSAIGQKAKQKKKDEPKPSSKQSGEVDLF